jgi:pyruvate/2-oxoglutarate dehydrogenase complex dihydrolipoamide dehydrogenase (E3) component
MSIEHVLIIGGGTAGIAATMEAKFYGAKQITLIEKETLGGECAHYACVPAKAWLTAAKYAAQTQQPMARFGFNPLTPSINPEKFQQTLHDIIYDGEYSIQSDPEVRIIEGHARFTDSKTIQVNGEKIQPSHVIIATGTTPFIPNIKGLSSVNYLTFRDVARLKKLPKSLIIMGGGAVAVEYGYVFSQLGVQVTMLNRSALPMKGEDDDIRHAMVPFLSRWGIQYKGEVNIQSIESVSDSSVKIHTSSGDVHQAEQLFMATGTQPNTASLGLENTSINVAENGSIQVNKWFETGEEGVYAIGDVIDQYKFTHVADRQAVYTIRHMANQLKTPMPTNDIAWSFYTHPEMTHVGFTEAQIKTNETPYKAITVPTSRVSRYRIEGEKEGVLKLLVNTDSHTILGAHALASQSDDWMQCVIIAIRQNLRVDDLLDTFYLYPSKAQLLQKALEDYAYEHIYTSPSSI